MRLQFGHLWQSLWIFVHWSMISIVLRLCQPSFIKCIRPDINIAVLYYNTFCIGLLFIGILSHFQQYYSYILVNWFHWSKQVPEENYQQVIDYLTNIMLYQVHLDKSWNQTHNFSGDKLSDCIDRSKSNYHMVMSTLLLPFPYTPPPSTH